MFELGNVIWIVLSTDHCLQMWLMNTEPGSEPGMEEIAEFVVMTRVFSSQLCMDLRWIIMILVLLLVESVHTFHVVHY